MVIRGYVVSKGLAGLEIQGLQCDADESVRLSGSDTAPRQTVSGQEHLVESIEKAKMLSLEKYGERDGLYFVRADVKGHVSYVNQAGYYLMTPELFDNISIEQIRGQHKNAFLSGGLKAQTGAAGTAR